MKLISNAILYLLMIAATVQPCYAIIQSSADTVPNTGNKSLAHRLSIPVYSFTAGSLIAGTAAGSNLETVIRNGFEVNRKHTSIDDYIQYAPAALVFAIEAAGMKGKYNPQTQLLMYGMGVIGTAAVVQPLKRIIARERPDGSDFRSFPSGHTSTAFAAAEFLNQEYGKKYPWISVAGYATAGLTGYLRMYNDQHWLGDVLAGAAIGMGTTKLIYWIKEKADQKKKRSLKIP